MFCSICGTVHLSEMPCGGTPTFVGAPCAKPEAVCPNCDEMRSQGQRERELSDVLAAALKELFQYREHATRCEINQTDFCTCRLNISAAISQSALAQHTASRSEAAGKEENGG